MIGYPGPLPGREPTGVCMGTCDHDRCNEDPIDCPQCEQPMDAAYCQNCYCARRGLRPDEELPESNLDAQGIDTHSDRAAYEMEDFTSPMDDPGAPF